MNLSIEQIIVIALPSAGAIVWFVRVEGRVNELKTLREADLAAAERQRSVDLGIAAERREADSQMINLQLDTVNASLDEIKESLKSVTDMQRKVDRISSFIGTGGSTNFSGS